MSREGLDQGWWRAPRWLGDELIDGRLSAAEFALVSFIASRRDAEEGRDGYATSIEFLRRVLRVSDKTVRRTLKRACSDDLLVSDLRQGQRTLFRVWIGPRLRSPLRSPLRSETTPSVTEVTSVTGVRRNAPESAPGAESREERLRSSRARAETETETETTAAVGEEALLRFLLPLETRAGGPLTGVGRSEVARAFAESPEGVTAVIERMERAAGTLRNPLGALVAAIRSGEHRQARELQERSDARRAVCPECGTGGGRHVAGCSRAPRASALTEPTPTHDVES